MQTGRERLKRVVSYAERKGALVLLENLNKEPAEAEVHYLAHTIEEWRYYFDPNPSPAFALSFPVNHPPLGPEGIPGFFSPLPLTPVAPLPPPPFFPPSPPLPPKPAPPPPPF